MKQRQSKLLNLLLLVSLIFGRETPLQAQTAIINSIIPQKGKVLLRREDWSDFHPVAKGTWLYEGDQIFPIQGVRVRIICPDRTNKPVTANKPSGLKTICPIWEVRIAKAPPAPGVLGGMNASIPYIISPRHSLLLSDTPTFRWNAVPGATEYTVELLGSNGVIWTAQVRDTQIVYPGNPSLEPGVSYSLNIRANTGQSSEQDGASNLGFILLRPAEAEIVKAEAIKIGQEEMSPLVNGLMLAEIYSNYVLPSSTLSAYNLTPTTARSYNLTARAIATLEALVQAGEREPILYRTRGDLYWQSGLTNLAIENYLKAIELATSPEYLEERTLTQFRLGEVSAATENSQPAICWYKQAKGGYLALGDTRLVDFLERRIKSMESRSSNTDKR